MENTKRKKKGREEEERRFYKPGSFHPPGPACLAQLLLMSRLLNMLFQLSLISFVVRQLFPT
jgi:hypothetical protein